MEWRAGRRAFTLVLMVTAAVLLGGCSGGSAPGPGSAEADEASFGDAETGAIDGVVVDEAVRPVEGVVVRLADRMNTVTDADGRFAFAYLPPGDVVLIAERDGYASAQAVATVAAGKATNVTIALVFIPAAEPFQETFQWSGVLLCGIAWTDPVLGPQATSCNGIVRSVPGFPPEFDSSGIAIPIGPLDGISGLWAELAWTAQSPAAAVMEANWGYSVDAERAFFQHVAQVAGPSTLSARVPVDLLYDALREAESVHCSLADCEMYGIPTSSSSLGTPGIDAGGQAEQAFDAFVTVFHNGPLPEAFSIAEAA